MKGQARGWNEPSRGPPAPKMPRGSPPSPGRHGPGCRRPAAPLRPRWTWTPPPTQTPAASNRALPAGGRPRCTNCAPSGRMGVQVRQGSEPSYRPSLARMPTPRCPRCARGGPGRRRPAAPAAVHAAQLCAPVRLGTAPSGTPPGPPGTVPPGRDTDLGESGEPVPQRWQGHAARRCLNRSP